jgi:two-component system, NtrC family, sensor kinase
VDKHGGQLKCISEPGQGTEFQIEVPIQQNSKVELKIGELIGNLV